MQHLARVSGYQAESNPQTSEISFRTT